MMRRRGKAREGKLWPLITKILGFSRENYGINGEFGVCPSWCGKIKIHKYLKWPKKYPKVSSKNRKGSLEVQEMSKSALNGQKKFQKSTKWPKNVHHEP